MSTSKTLTLFILLNSLTFLFFLPLLIYRDLFHNPANLAANDFSHFYTSAIMVKAGHGPNLYNRQIFNRFQTQVSFPYPYPRLTYRSLPFVSIFYIPFTFFSYPQAYLIFILLSLLQLLLSLILLKHLFPPITHFPLWFIFIFSFTPVIHSLAQGQTSIFFLLLVLLTTHLLLHRRHFSSGLLFSLLLIKPHLFIILGLFFLVVVRQTRFFFGLLLGSLTWLILSFCISGVSPLLNYPRFLLSTENSIYGTFILNYPGFNSFLQTFIPPISANLITFCLLVFIFFLFISKSSPKAFLRQISLLILIVLPLTFHAPVYEFSLLIIPLYYLLSLAHSTPKPQFFLVAFAFLISIFILGWINPWQPPISIFLLILGLSLFLTSPVPTPIPSSPPLVSTS